jgi:exodeoxyribonuclease VII large subunit
MSSDTEYNVYEINSLIKQSFHKLFDEQMTIIGEISNFKKSGNNTFFTLKDKYSSINVTAWGNTMDKDNIKNGIEAKVVGKISQYKTNQTNILLNKIHLIGDGKSETSFQKLKNICENNGLFDRKRDIPKIFNSIGIITSKNGAALQDILFVLKKNKYLGKVLIAHSVVQGERCPLSVINNIKRLQNYNLDAIIITRGGGSLEDLMGFSDEVVLQEIYNSKIYTISAVGHETDNMLSDYVADIRLPTPSLAGEFIINNQNKVLNSLVSYKNTNIDLCNNILKDITDYKQQLQNIKITITTQLKDLKHELMQQQNNLLIELENIIKQDNIKIDKYKTIIETNNPLKHLSRGYSIITTGNHHIINDVNNIKKDQNIKIILNNGQVTIKVGEIIKVKEELNNINNIDSLNKNDTVVN